MNRDVHPGLSGHTRRSPGSDSGEPACPVINRPNAVSANRAFKRAACCCRRTAFRQLCGTCVPARYDPEMQPMLPGILHIRPCGAGSEPVVYPSLCRHAVRPFRVRNHRTYSLSGLISSLRVTARVFLGLQPFLRKTVSKAFNNPGPEAARPYRWAA